MRTIFASIPIQAYMKAFLLIFLTVFSLYAQCQDQAIATMKTETLRPVKNISSDTIKKAWKKGGLYNINIAQGALSNWAAGGDDFTFSINSLLSLFASFKKNKFSWDNTFDYNLGYIKTTSLGSRKNDDRFDLFSKFGYRIGKKINLAGLCDLRSQFFNGYTYSDNTKTLSSSFFSPAYLVTSLGLDFKPAKNLSAFISPVSSRWTIVKNPVLSPKGLYGLDSNRHIRNEIGAFATISYFVNMNKVVGYRARLDLLSNYKHNPQNIDLYMSNLMTVKLARLLSITWSVDLIYDDDVKLFGKEHSSPSLQLKSLVGVGLLMKLG